jgi:hypothetical protein
VNRLAFAALLFVAAPAFADTPEPPRAAPTVSLPATLTTKVGAWVLIPADVSGGSPQWYLPDGKKADGSRATHMRDAAPSQGLAEVPLASIFGDDWALKARGRVFTSDVPGIFRVCAYNARGDVASLISTCVVTVEGAGPSPPGPTPGPNPPGPQPPGPAPGPVANLRVLVVYDTATVTKLPAGQQSVLYAKAVRDALDSATAVGPDGKTHNWRMWDAGTDASGEGGDWAALLKRPHAALPWVIFAGDGGVAYEGPLPAAVPDMLALIQKYAPKSLRKAG